MASKVTNQQQGWSSQEANMANTYKNIANMLPTIRQYMLGHVENVKNGNGIITLGDFQEAFTQLETMINDRLRSSFNSRVSITLSNTQTQNSNGVAQQNIQRESKSLKGKKRLTETQLNRVIKESTKKFLKELLHEGKNVNNKPYFGKFNRGAKDWDEHIPTGKMYKKGEHISYFDKLGNVYAYGGELPERRQTALAADLHNERVNKQFDEKAYFNDKKKMRENFFDMLKWNMISLNDYQNMDEEQQNEYWEEWRAHNRWADDHSQERFWEEEGDPNWNNIYDTMY